MSRAAADTPAKPPMTLRGRVRPGCHAETTSAKVPDCTTRPPSSR